MTDEDLGLARRLWTLYEPVHAVVYFHPTAFAAFEAAGLRGFWRGYFAQRAAPLGPVGEAPVRAAFFNFSRSFTARALPAVWELITPQAALDARRTGTAATLRELLADDVPPRDVEHVADDLWALAAEHPADGRVLAAANLALPRPDDPYERLWQACTTLREHRGDGHVAALLTAGLTGLEALVLRGAADLEADRLQAVRGWTDDEWQGATEELTGRGLISQARVTDAGQALLAEVEHVTDELAWRGWTTAGGTVADARRLAHHLHRAAVLCRAVLPPVNPIGVPEVGVDAGVDESPGHPTD
ncbi:hypothetical protein ACIB24_19575 [Spongisporangium articulatum]|uniref:SalK n=1 Tax=Spongisporangium articulatum TaxID=3362603 RepID=A0ABW8ASB9_9ACTN